jgi:hypothetical protein
VYPNVFLAARSIVDAAGVRGLFTGYLPTLLEDVPDMAFKFAAYESLRGLHRRLSSGRSASAQVLTHIYELGDDTGSGCRHSVCALYGLRRPLCHCTHWPGPLLPGHCCVRPAPKSPCCRSCMSLSF